MGAITKHGQELAAKLRLPTPVPPSLLREASLLCRYARTYQRVQEDHCNGHPVWQQGASMPLDRCNKLQEQFERRLERTEARCEQAMTRALHKLKAAGAPAKGLRLGGDPRGCTVKIVMEDETLHDDWGREGLCVPTSQK